MAAGVVPARAKAVAAAAATGVTARSSAKVGVLMVSDSP